MGSASPEPKISFNKKIEAQYRLLYNGKKCPIMGLGTALVKEEKDIEIVYQSIIDGVRLIDTGPPNEEFVGKGIQKAIREGKVKREELFIVTKLELEEKENPESALRKSLKNLQLDYVDLYLDHWPSCICVNNRNKYKLIPVKDTWKKMESLVDLGLTRSIGLSNYNAENIFNVLSICRINPAVNEVEFHPYLYQKDLKDICDKEKILIFAYNPLAKGEYVDRKDASDKNVNLFNDSIICKLKDEYPPLNKGQIILNWHLRLGVVPIPGTSKTDRMKTNLQANSFRLSYNVVELMGRDEFNQHRFNDGSDIFGINIFA